jgi:hypothetical protein
LLDAFVLRVSNLNLNSMKDSLKNKRYLEILGIKKAKALYEEAGEEAVYPGAVVHEWIDEQIDKALNRKVPLLKIAQKYKVSGKTVIRHRNKLFGFKSKKPVAAK